MIDLILRGTWYRFLPSVFHGQVDPQPAFRTRCCLIRMNVGWPHSDLIFSSHRIGVAICEGMNCRICRSFAVEICTQQIAKRQDSLQQMVGGIVVRSYAI